MTQPCNGLKTNLLDLENPDVKAVLARLRQSSIGATSNEQCFKSLRQKNVQSRSVSEQQLFKLLARHPSTRTPNGFLRFWRAFFQDMPWNVPDNIKTFLQRLKVEKQQSEKENQANLKMYANLQTNLEAEQQERRLARQEQKKKQIQQAVKKAEMAKDRALKANLGAHQGVNSLFQLRKIAGNIKQAEFTAETALHTVPDAQKKKIIQTYINDIKHFHKAVLNAIAREQERLKLQNQRAARVLEEFVAKQKQIQRQKPRLRKALQEFIERMNVVRAPRMYRCRTHNDVVDGISFHYVCDGRCTLSKDDYTLMIDLNNSTMVLQKNKAEIVRSDNGQIDEAILGPILKTFGPSILSSLDSFTLPCTKQYKSFQTENGCLQQAFADLNIIDTLLTSESIIQDRLQTLSNLIRVLRINRSKMDLSNIIDNSKYEFKVNITADEITFGRNGRTLIEYNGTMFTNHLRNLDLYRNEKGALHDRTDLDPDVLEYAIRQFKKMGILFEKRNHHPSWGRKQYEDADPVRMARQSLSLQTLLQLSTSANIQKKIRDLMADSSERSVNTANQWKSFY